MGALVDLAKRRQDAAAAEARKARAVAHLEAQRNAQRACFTDTTSDPAWIVFTVAVRDSAGSVRAVEMAVERATLDAIAALDLSNAYAYCGIPDQ